jgi:hypothetical protein
MTTTDALIDFEPLQYEVGDDNPFDLERNRRGVMVAIKTESGSFGKIACCCIRKRRTSSREVVKGERAGSEHTLLSLIGSARCDGEVRR